MTLHRMRRLRSFLPAFVAPAFTCLSCRHKEPSIPDTHLQCILAVIALMLATRQSWHQAHHVIPGLFDDRPSIVRPSTAVCQFKPGIAPTSRKSRSGITGGGVAKQSQFQRRAADASAEGMHGISFRQSRPAHGVDCFPGASVVTWHAKAGLRKRLPSLLYLLRLPHAWAGLGAALEHPHPVCHLLHTRTTVTSASCHGGPRRQILERFGLLLVQNEALSGKRKLPKSSMKALVAETPADESPRLCKDCASRRPPASSKCGRNMQVSVALAGL